MRLFFLFVTILLFFFPRFSFSQDTAAVNVLLAKGWRMMGEKNDSVGLVYEEAFRVSRKIKYEYGIGAAMTKLAALKARSDFRASVSMFHEAMSHLLNTPDYQKAIGILYTLSEMHEQVSNLDSAIYFAMEAIRLHQKADSTFVPVWCYVKVSSLYNHINEYQKAANYAQRALAASHKEGYQTYRAIANIAMSRTFREQQQNDSSLAYATYALKDKETIGAYFLCQAYNNLADEYNSQNQPALALLYANKALECHKTGNVSSIDRLYTYLALAEAYYRNNDFDQSRTWLKTVMKRSGAYAQAIYAAPLYDLLAKVYFKLGRYKTAYAYKDSATQSFVRMTDAKNRFAISSLEIQYQSALKDKILSEKQLQIAQAHLQLQKNRQYISYNVAATVLALVVAIVVLLIYLHKKRIHARQLQMLKQEKELHLMQALVQGEEKERSRIAKDLHDGVAGMLAAIKMHISSLAIKHKGVENNSSFQQAIHLANEACHEVRKTAHNLMPEVLLQHGLDEALARYCSNISNASTIVIQYDSLGSISRFAESFELSVYRIVQELLNNILKHSKATHAIVQMSQQNNLLSITIEDNGIGFTNNNINSDGMGLKSLQSRIKAINGRIELDSGVNSCVSAYLEFETASLKKEMFV